MYFCTQEQSACDLACDCSTSSVHKSTSQTDFFCTVLVLQSHAKSHALCSLAYIIAVKNNGCIHGLLSDLEYAKAMSNESASLDPKKF